MSQIYWLRIEVKKVKWGWQAYLLTESGHIFRKFWRPSKRWAYSAAAIYHRDYIWAS